MSSNVTIYDVAQAAGVSVATVSRVMNEPSKVALEKRQVVLEAIERLNFVPKADAVINARKSYRKIGVVAPFFTQPSFMERLRGISSVLYSERYELVIDSIDTESDMENYVSSLVSANRVDGLIFMCIRLKEKVLRLLSKSGIPACFVEDKVEGFDCVIVKNLEGGMRAAEYLWELGCRNPGFIGEEADRGYAVGAMDDRLRGYRFAFADHGVVPDEGNFWIGQFKKGNIDNGIEKVLSQHPLPDCIFCSSDLIAARVMMRAQERGIRIPSQMKILGFDNIDIASYIELSSVNQKLDESGKLAARLLLERLADQEKTPPRMEYLDLEIVGRGSTEARRGL